VSFLETVRRARAHLEEQDRVSLRALKREFELDDDALDELVEELVDVQQVAVRERQVLVWVGPARSEPAITELSRVERDPRADTPKHLADKILRKAGEGLEAALGDESRREQYLREAQRLFTEMSATGNAERLARERSS
jgi:hypothetical protein